MSLISVTHASMFLTLSIFYIGVVSAQPSSRVLRENSPCKQGECLEKQQMEDLIAELKLDLKISKENQITIEEKIVILENSRLVMGISLYVLVPIIFLGLALVILKLYLPSFLKDLKQPCYPEQRPSSTQCQYIGRLPSSTKNISQLSVSAIRLANRQSSGSPCPARNQIPINVPHSTPEAEENTVQAAPPGGLMRQPSESTCPVESSDASQGCDNLGLSSSTLHNQTTSSSNISLGGAINSTSTLNTMVSSENSLNHSNYMIKRF